MSVVAHVVFFAQNRPDIGRNVVLQRQVAGLFQKPVDACTPPALYRLTQQATRTAAEPRAVDFVAIRFGFLFRLADRCRLDARKIGRLVFVLRVFKRTKLL